MNLRALSTEKIRKTQIDTLQSKLDALRHDLAIEVSEAQLFLERFAKTDCRRFTDLMGTKLPRELRDIVYLHLNGRSEKHIDEDYFRSTQDPATKCYSFDCARWKSLHYPEHFWKTEYVGETFIRELAESYYRTSTFIFDDSKGVVQKFLNTDELGLNFAPKIFISDIELRVRAYCHDCNSFHAYMYGLVKSPARLQVAFEGVLELRRSANLRVHFLTQAKSAKERNELFISAMPELLSNLEKASLAGYNVNLTLDEEFEFKLGPRSLEDWKEKLACLPWPWPIDTYESGGLCYA